MVQSQSPKGDKTKDQMEVKKLKVNEACVPAVSVNGLNLPQSNPQPEGDRVSRNHGRS